MKTNEIKSLRKKLGLSHREFAKAVRLTGKNSFITVYKWESGDRHPSQQSLALMKELNEEFRRTSK